MMETKTAVENMASILDVEGINGVYIGPSDLGFSYGLAPKLDREEPEILRIYEKIVKECGKRGLYPGIHCSGAVGAAKAINMGFKLVTLANESGLMESEEHTSELQSHLNLVCRLLLEKTNTPGLNTRSSLRPMYCFPRSSTVRPPPDVYP